MIDEYVEIYVYYFNVYIISILFLLYFIIIGIEHLDGITSTDSEVVKFGQAF
jgi:hypothetical protein